VINYTDNMSINLPLLVHRDEKSGSGRRACDWPCVSLFPLLLRLFLFTAEVVWGELMDSD